MYRVLFNLFNKSRTILNTAKKPSDYLKNIALYGEY